MIFDIDQRAPSAPALTEGADGPIWDTARLRAEVSRRAEGLASPSKLLVFLFARNNLESVAWYLAALEAGQAVALLSDALDPGFRDDLLNRYEPERVVLASRPSPDYHQTGWQNLWVRDAVDADLGIHADIDAGIHPDLAVMLSTSGTTGSPKFVRLSRRNVEANAASIAQGLGISPSDLPVAHLPIHYSYGLSVLNSHLQVGANVLLTNDGLVAPGFWQMVRTRGATSFSGVPYTYQMLRRLGLERLNAPSLLTMTQAGGKLDEPTIAHFHSSLASRGGTFWVMYGQTEATARIAILPAGDLPRKLGSAGLPIAGGSFSIVTDAGPAGPGQQGELVYRGPNVMLGYAMERADLAKGDEMGGRLPTGDRAYLDEEGFLYVVGRNRRDAKLFGLRINLDEVEGLVRAYGAAAVVSQPNRLVVWCEFGDAAQFDVLRGELSDKLRLHQSAFDFRRINALPTQESGKVDYDALRDEP